MPKIAIKVENLSKVYQIGQFGTGTISRDLERWYARLRGKQDPFLQIGSKHHTIKNANELVWSLKDVNLEIEQGQAVGIIGRNGAGKSTLLKILSKVTAPTSGKISGQGRIASLLEVGTGFHPELSGRENIFLNGAILGMRKKEIQRKLSEIVDFAGIELYLDTPVKRYSSGMYVRLAFAVAAHLESEILIVDEVLAVGDAEFQKKCLGKMGEVSKGEGKTVLFVSHNINSIKDICNKAIYLNKGTIKHNGSINETVRLYQRDNNVTSTLKEPAKSNNNGLIFSSIAFAYDRTEYIIFENIKILATLLNYSYKKNIVVAIMIYNSIDELITHIINEDDNLFLNKINSTEKLNLEITLKNVNLPPGSYYISLWAGESILAESCLDTLERALHFEIVKGNVIKRLSLYPINTKVYLESEWTRL